MNRATKDFVEWILQPGAMRAMAKMYATVFFDVELAASELQWATWEHLTRMGMDERSSGLFISGVDFVKVIKHLRGEEV